MARHTPVLLQETIDGLSLLSGQSVLDATVGAGGHARELCQAVGMNGTLIGIDADSDALALAGEALADCTATVHLIEANFRTLGDVLHNLHISEIDGVLFDLGLRSEQIERSGRGFSFLRDEPLAMTFRKPDAETPTARDVVNHWSEKQLADVLYHFADERYARRIARALVTERKKKPFVTTQDLVAVIEQAVPHRGRPGSIHPATRTFQALRMAVNDELGALSDGLEQALAHLRPHGRIAVISFHSVEDRFVKQWFVAQEKGDLGKRITKRPIIPTDEEQHTNPRARSAKLRLFEKTSRT